MALPPRHQHETDAEYRRRAYPNTTPRPGEPRLSRSDEHPLPLRTRIEIIVSLGFTAWGFAMVLVAVCSSL